MKVSELFEAETQEYKIVNLRYKRTYKDGKTGEVVKFTDKIKAEDFAKKLNGSKSIGNFSVTKIKKKD